MLREPGSGTRSEFEAALSTGGVPPEALKIVLELPTNEAVRAAVEAGAGITDFRTRCGGCARAGTLIAMAFQLPTRPFLVLHHRDRYQSKAAQEFLRSSPNWRSRSPLFRHRGIKWCQLLFAGEIATAAFQGCRVAAQDVPGQNAR